MKIATVSEMRQLDKTASEQFGIKEELLMENAGESAYFILSEHIRIQGKKFVIFCGGGNNGGDGFVVARKIHSSGGCVSVCLLGDRTRYKGAAAMNLDIILKSGIEVIDINSAKQAKDILSDCDAVVDAIFGTGLARDVTGTYSDVINLINKAEKPVLSLDIPSGVAGDTGKIMGTAVKADLTVTFGLPKLGNMFFPGNKLGGKLYVTHISFPPLIYDIAGPINIETNELVPLPPRNAAGHKGDFGDVLFIAGASTYFGAPYFAALSFLKAGGGYARLAAPKSIVPFIATNGHEIVFIPQEETTEGSISIKNTDPLLKASEKTDMVVLGPGLSLNRETGELARQLVSQIKQPLLIDGDGITAISKDIDIIRHRDNDTILTPHLGEMSRITGRSVSEIDNNRIEILRDTVKRLGAFIVLKGFHSLIGCPDGRIFINLTGNSGMASAGSGDVLTGTIAAMYGLGLPVEEAVRNGVFIHGAAGDMAAETKGEDGITAHDIMESLPHALKAARENNGKDMSEHYRGVRIV